MIRLLSKPLERHLLMCTWPHVLTVTHLSLREPKPYLPAISCLGTPEQPPAATATECCMWSSQLGSKGPVALWDALGGHSRGSIAQDALCPRKPHALQPTVLV